MVEAFFGFKKTPFCDSPDPKQLFCSQAWNQAKARLQFLADHHGVGLLTGEVGAGKSTAHVGTRVPIGRNAGGTAKCEFRNGTISSSRAEITRLGIPSFAKCAKEGILFLFRYIVIIIVMPTVNPPSGKRGRSRSS
jgi:hypothetical protein